MTSPTALRTASPSFVSPINSYRLLTIIGVALTLLGLIAIIGTFHPHTEEFTSFFMGAGEVTAKIAKYLNVDPLPLSFFALSLGASLWTPAAIYWSTLPSKKTPQNTSDSFR